MFTQLNMVFDKDQTVKLANVKLTELQVGSLIAQLGRNQNLTSLTLDNIGLTANMSEHLYEEVLSSKSTLKKLVISNAQLEDTLPLHLLKSVDIAWDNELLQHDEYFKVFYDLDRDQVLKESIAAITKVEMDDLIKNKLNPAYLSKFIDLASKLKDNAQALNNFFELLLSNPRDATGTYEIILFMHCLNSSNLPGYLLSKNVLLSAINQTIQYYLTNVTSNVTDRLLKALSDCPHLYQSSPIKDTLLAELRVKTTPPIVAAEGSEVVGKIIKFIDHATWSDQEVTNAVCDYLENEHYWQARLLYCESVMGARQKMESDLCLIISALGKIIAKNNHVRGRELLVKISNGRLCQNAFAENQESLIWPNIKIKTKCRAWEYYRGSPTIISHVVKAAKLALGLNHLKWQPGRVSKTIETIQEEYSRGETYQHIYRTLDFLVSQIGNVNASSSDKYVVHKSMIVGIDERSIWPLFAGRGIDSSLKYQKYSMVNGFPPELVFLIPENGAEFAIFDTLGDHLKSKKKPKEKKIKEMRQQYIDYLLKNLNTHRKIAVDGLSRFDLTSYLGIICASPNIGSSPEILFGTPFLTILNAYLKSKTPALLSMLCQRVVSGNIPVYFETNNICFYEDNQFTSIELTTELNQTLQKVIQGSAFNWIDRLYLFTLDNSTYRVAINQYCELLKSIAAGVIHVNKNNKSEVPTTKSNETQNTSDPTVKKSETVTQPEIKIPSAIVKWEGGALTRFNLPKAIECVRANTIRCVSFSPWEIQQLSQAEAEKLIRELSDALKTNTSACELYTHANNFPDLRSIVTFLTPMFRSNKSIRHVDFSYSHVNDGVVNELANALAQNLSVTTLFLQGNSIGAVGSEQLVTLQSTAYAQERYIRIFFPGQWGDFLHIKSKIASLNEEIENKGKGYLQSSHTLLDKMTDTLPDRMKDLSTVQDSLTKAHTIFNHSDSEMYGKLLKLEETLASELEILSVKLEIAELAKITAHPAEVKQPSDTFSESKPKQQDELPREKFEAKSDRKVFSLSLSQFTEKLSSIDSTNHVKSGVKEHSTVAALDATKFYTKATHSVPITLFAKTKPTIGEGDCLFHAMCGEWSEMRQAYYCNNVRELRTRVSTAMKECKTGDAIYNLVKATISEVIMEQSGSQTISPGASGPQMQKAIADYKIFKISDDKQCHEAWMKLEKILIQNEDVLAYMDTEEKIQSKNRKLQFQTCLSKKNSKLLEMIQKQRDLNGAYQIYITETKNAFAWDELLKNREIINEYADATIGVMGRHLLPVELQISAHVLGVRVEYETFNNITSGLSSSEIYNLNGARTVKIRYNGSNHYERVVDQPAAGLAKMNLS